MEKSKALQPTNAKRTQHHETTFTTNAKGTYLGGKHRREKNRHTETNPKKEKGNRNIYIDNYLKCKWIKCSNKRHRLAELTQNKTRIYAVYKRPTSDPGTHIV